MVRGTLSAICRAGPDQEEHQMTGNFDRIRSSWRPAHPPVTDFPIAGYVFAAAFDLISAVGGRQHDWARGLWHAGTFVLVGGLAICLVTMGTGLWDLFRFPPRSRGAVRTAAAHVAVMGGAFMMGAGDLAWRLGDYGLPAAPSALVVLSLATAVAACSGAFLGGKLVFGYGVGVAAAVAPLSPAATDAADPVNKKLPAADGPADDGRDAGDPAAGAHTGRHQDAAGQECAAPGGAGPGDSAA
jgi:uncharacterized membrane protein